MAFKLDNTESTPEMPGFLRSQKNTQTQQNLSPQSPHVSLNIENPQMSSHGNESVKHPDTSNSTQKCSEKPMLCKNDELTGLDTADKDSSLASTLAREASITSHITMGDYWGVTRCDTVELSDLEEVDEEQRKSDMDFIDECIQTPNDNQVRYNKLVHRN